MKKPYIKNKNVMAKRLNVERRLGNQTFKAKVGSVNRLNPVSIYVTGKAYISPNKELGEYGDEIDALDQDLKGILRRYTKNNPFLNKVFISNLEVPKNALKYGKNTYLFFQLFFSQNFSNPVCKNIEKIKENLLPGINDALDEFKINIEERGFTIHEKRK